MDFAFYDGCILPLTEVRLAIDDRAYFFGDGVYEAMVGNQSEIYLLRKHLERFYKSLSALSLVVDYTEEEISKILGMLIEKTGGQTCFLYMQASRRKSERSHPIGDAHKTHFFAYAKSFCLPDENRRLSLVTTEDKRYEFCHIKTVNLLPNVLASSYAEERGADEAVFVKEGIVRECSHSNISILVDGVLKTHPLDCHILPGIMREALLFEARKMGIPIEESPFTVDEMLRAEGVFITSTTRRSSLAREVDGQLLPEPSARALSLHGAVNATFYRAMQKK